MTKEERDEFVKAIETHLDTRDKRYMFLKIFFPRIVPNIQLEGSARETAWNIYTEFDKQNMDGSLMATLNTTFDLDLTLTH